MKLTVLTENTACRPQIQAVHGLSLLLETEGRHILLDVGPGPEFAENAKLLNVDLDQVEFCVISHGHDDHGGGLHRFLEENTHAPVYLAKGAFDRHFSGRGEIGLATELAQHPRIHMTDAVTLLDDQVTLFSAVPGEELVPSANQGLLDEHGPDGFLHEQDMLIREGKRLYLFGGCAHRGIVNIMERAKTLAGRYPDVVVSGFHLAAGGTGKCMADDAYLDALGKRLLDTGAQFYSCHCTGPEGLERLKKRMGTSLTAISGGEILEI